MTNPDPAPAIARYEAKQEAIKQMFYRLENEFEALGAMWVDEIKPLMLQQGNGAPPLVFSSPVTGTTEIWGGDWFSAVGYAVSYSNGTAYHTGCDLNRPNYADAGKPVYAAADGQIVFSGVVLGWQGQVVVIDHGGVWTRYAHIKDAPGLGPVKRGQQIGIIADYDRNGPKGDHLHYDVARIDLGARPDDWPGNNKARVISDYHDPVKWHKDHAG